MWHVIDNLGDLHLCTPYYLYLVRHYYSNPHHPEIIPSTLPTNKPDSRITIPHQRTLQSLSIVTSVLLREHNQCNQPWAFHGSLHGADPTSYQRAEEDTPPASLSGVYTFSSAFVTGNQRIRDERGSTSSHLRVRAVQNVLIHTNIRRSILQRQRSSSVDFQELHHEQMTTREIVSVSVEDPRQPSRLITGVSSESMYRNEASSEAIEKT